MKLQELELRIKTEADRLYEMRKGAQEGAHIDYFFKSAGQEIDPHIIYNLKMFLQQHMEELEASEARYEALVEEAKSLIREDLKSHEATGSPHPYLKSYDRGVWSITMRKTKTYDVGSIREGMREKGVNPDLFYKVKKTFDPNLVPDQLIDVVRNNTSITKSPAIKFKR